MQAIELIEKLGGTYSVADLCNVKPPSVSGWKEVNRIPDAKLIRLAPIAEARGIVSRKDLFPNDWQAIWPELEEGKPTEPWDSKERRTHIRRKVDREAAAGKAV